MNRKLTVLTFALLALLWLLVACSPPGDSSTAAQQPPESTQPAAGPSAADGWPDGQVQTSAEGAVTVAITPLNLNSPANTLQFEVTLNTHSVELDMDLAALSTLATDNGLTAEPIRWEAPSGGHHVSGVLSFPATVEGQALLEGATTITVTIRDLDTPQRLFYWSISG
jgi:hypothetical protein